MFGRLLALALLLAPSADTPVLTANAGFDGVGRPGRWLPVHVTIDARQTDIDGELVAEWGRARVRRAVAIAAPSHRDFEIYLRTGDVRDAVVVRLETRGQQLARVTIPIRIVGDDTQATLTVPERQWPASWRGYDAADDVVFESGSPPSQPARDAFALWGALRNSGDIERSLPPAQPLAPPASPEHYVAVTLVTYTLFVAAAALMFGRITTRPVLLYAGAAIAVIAGTAGAWAAGRSAAVLIRHQSYAEQFEGSNSTLITMRAIAQYPTDGRFVLRADMTDGVLDADGMSHGAADETVFDADGRPTLDVRAAVGGTASFTVQGTSSFRAFEVTRRDRDIGITNASSSTLEDCVFPDGVHAAVGRGFGPGQHVEARLTDDIADPVVSCALDASPLAFAEPNHPISMEGRTIAVYHFARGRR